MPPLYGAIAMIFTPLHDYFIFFMRYMLLPLMLLLMLISCRCLSFLRFTFTLLTIGFMHDAMPPDIS